jgi:ABC-type Zn2+ transport system substrate-binding protein/surface adhesin
MPSRFDFETDDEYLAYLEFGCESEHELESEYELELEYESEHESEHEHELESEHESEHEHELESEHAQGVYLYLLCLYDMCQAMLKSDVNTYVENLVMMCDTVQMYEL